LRTIGEKFGPHLNKYSLDNISATPPLND